jgi:hypothetical protein
MALARYLNLNFSSGGAFKMRSLVGLVGLVMVLGIGMFVYRSYFEGPSGGAITMGTSNPRAIADVTGVKNDLLAMAQAERAYLALNGHYASLEDLHASGDLVVDPARVREGYSYTAELGEKTFVITANYSGPATGMPTLSIDESMQISQQ